VQNRVAGPPTRLPQRKPEPCNADCQHGSGEESQSNSLKKTHAPSANMNENLQAGERAIFRKSPKANLYYLRIERVLGEFTFFGPKPASFSPKVMHGVIQLVSISTRMCLRIETAWLAP
jgi:hypothetical protein